MMTEDSDSTCFSVRELRSRAPGSHGRRAAARALRTQALTLSYSVLLGTSYILQSL